MAKRKKPTANDEELKEFGAFMVELPELEPLPSERIYCQRQVQSTLAKSEAETLKRLLITLEFAGVRLSDGTFVRRPTHAIRWLLERIARAEDSSLLNSNS